MTQSLRLASDVMVPMRDGVRLATDIYSPATSAGPWPAKRASTAITQMPAFFRPSFNSSILFLRFLNF